MTLSFFNILRLSSNIFCVDYLIYMKFWNGFINTNYVKKIKWTGFINNLVRCEMRNLVDRFFVGMTVT